MRTVNATLTTALLAGRPRPFIKAYVGYSNGVVKNSHTKVWAYRLTGQTLEFWIPSVTNFGSDQEQIWLERGLTIAGTDYTVTTGRFWIWEEEYLPNQVSRFKGGILPRAYYTDSLTNDTYEQVIDALFAAFGKTTTYAAPAEAWLDYQFLPNPSTLILSDAERMLSFLAQKRLIGVCDNGSEDVRVFCTDVLPAHEDTLTIKDEFSLWTTKQQRRQYLWRDELGVAHQDGTATDPVHNLGFLLSTESPPARNVATYNASIYTRPDLRWQDGDSLRFSLYGGTLLVTFWVKVTEEWDAHSTTLPNWRLKLDHWPVFSNSEGADLPSAVAHSGNYAHVNTSQFDGFLSAYETNIQSALNALDDHPSPDILGAQIQGSVVATGATRYSAPFHTNYLTTEMQTAWPRAGTLAKVTVRTSGAQPATGSLVITLRVNGADTALVVTIAAGAAAGTYADTTHSVTLAANDLISFKIVNNAAASSAPLQSITTLLDQSPT